MRGSRPTMSRTVMPPLPAPTCTRCANEMLLCSTAGVASFRFGERPFTGLVPDLVTREPAPGSLHREHARVFRRIPAAGLPVASLSPHAQDLSFEQMRARYERGQDLRLRRLAWIVRRQARLQMIDIVHRLETIAKEQSLALPL